MNHRYLHAHIADGELIIAVIAKTLVYAVAILKVGINNKHAFINLQQTTKILFNTFNRVAFIRL